MPRPRTILAIAALALAGCAGRGIPATLDPPVAADAVAATAPDQARRVVFAWRMLDGEARFSGSGVARMEPPYRARLDLFGPRDEAVLSAALIDQELRLPPGAPPVPLPPPALMWAVLGAVVPPPGATLAGTAVTDDVTELHYTVEGGRLWYRLESGRLDAVSWEADGRRMNVELSGRAAGSLPANAVYRDWSAYNELSLTVEEVDEVDSFPSEIWRPDE